MPGSFEGALAALAAGAAPRAPAGLVQRVQRLHHVQLPADLAALVELHDRCVPKHVDLGPWEALTGAAVPGDVCAPGGDGNLFEQLVGLDQAHYYGSFGLMQYAGRVIPVGKLKGAGDQLQATLLDDGQVRVALMDPEVHLLVGFVADEVAELASWSEAPDVRDEEHRFLADYARNRAFASLLSNVLPEFWQSDFEDAWDLYLEFDPPGPVPLARAAVDSAAAFHHLWAPFFMGDDAALAAGLRTCAVSPAPMIRDMAQLVEAFAAGRQTLGTIANMQARRAWVQAQGLDLG